MAGKPRYLLNRDGRYFARLVIPPELRPFMDGDDKGRTELRTPLGPDYRTAIKRLHIAVADLQSKLAVAERRHAEANRKPLPLAPRYPARPLDAPGAAAWTYRSALGTDERLRDTMPIYAQSTAWDVDALEELTEAVAGKLDNPDLAEVTRSRMDALARAGFALPDPGTPEWRGFARAVAAGALEGFNRIAERDEGDFAGTPSHPTLREGLAREEAPEPVRLRALFRDYLADRQRVGKGRTLAKDWGPVIDHLIAFLGHDDARSITKRDLLDWRDKLLEDRGPRTVAMVYLASVRTIFNWAVREDRLEANPAQDVRQEVPKAVRTREKGFTPAEARAVVAAALAYAPVPDMGVIREYPETSAFKRWGPILCAHTGARVGEMAQVRKEDVRREGDHHVLRITPAAGTVKAGGYRDVPVHAELVALGFLDFVDAAAPGPLFYRADKGQPSRPKAEAVTKRLTDFLHAGKLVPEGVSPNHAWRHRFKTVASEIGASDRIVDAICGHAGRTAGDNYGDVTVTAKARVIDQMPRLAAGIGPGMGIVSPIPPMPGLIVIAIRPILSR